MRLKKSSHTDDVSSWLSKPVHSFIPRFFIGLSILWAICAVFEGLGLFYAFDIDWADVFPGRSHSVTISVFGFTFSLILGFWLYSFSAHPARQDAIYGFVGLIVSTLLWYQLTQDFSSSANEVDASWLWLSIVLTCVFTLLALRLYAKRMLLFVAACVAVPVVAEIFTGNDGSIALYAAAYWLNGEGAWSPVPVIFFVMFPICLLAWRADQITFGYKYKRRVLALIAKTAKLPHSIFRPLNSQNLYWRKQSFVFLFVLIGLIGDRFELEHVALILLLLGVLSFPILLAGVSQFRGLSRRDRYKKLYSALLYLILPVVLSCAVFWENFFVALAFASFSAALQFQHNGSHPTRTADFSCSLTAYVCSVAYSAVFLLFIALLAWVLGMLVPLLRGYHELFDLHRYEAIIFSSLISIAVIGLFGKLRGRFEKSYSDAVLAGFLVFLYFSFVEGKSPGMSGGLAVIAMLVGTVFGAMAIELIDRRKGLILALSNAGRETYLWAIGCPTVLIPLFVIGITVGALYGIRFLTIHYLL